jgi:hypothetical protein
VILPESIRELAWTASEGCRAATGSDDHGPELVRDRGFRLDVNLILSRKVNTGVPNLTILSGIGGPNRALAERPRILTLTLNRARRKKKVETEVSTTEL